MFLINKEFNMDLKWRNNSTWVFNKETIQYGFAYKKQFNMVLQTRNNSIWFCNQETIQYCFTIKKPSNLYAALAAGLIGSIKTLIKLSEVRISTGITVVINYSELIHPMNSISLKYVPLNSFIFPYSGDKCDSRILFGQTICLKFVFNICFCFFNTNILHNWEKHGGYILL